MKKTCLSMIVLAATLGGPANAEQAPAAADVLKKSIAYHDPDDLWKIVDALPDPAGTFYRFGLADSALQRALDWEPPEQPVKEDSES